mmetsp:Transcript_22070/g.32167  ORF Transcript_22070/g.32167 Transcript_22070/m.32167 type:complete len:202 (+) Transcript_22070:122-727(+)
MPLLRFLYTNHTLYTHPTRASRLLTSHTRRLHRSHMSYTTSVQYICKNEDDIELIGRKFAEWCGVGDVLLLSGDLGAGKTCFSRGLIRAVTGQRDLIVTSPSYLLDNTYPVQRNGRDFVIHHIDLYRLPHGCDLSFLNIPSIYSSSITLIEWPDRLSNLPKQYFGISLHIQPNQDRVVTFEPNGDDDYKERCQILLKSIIE